MNLTPLLSLSKAKMMEDGELILEDTGNQKMTSIDLALLSFSGIIYPQFAIIYLTLLPLSVKETP
ncbi:hypothetical protein P0Y35_02535 [Kiritimatiellaeota bacterium B1221]|nr:hypothetical protein [Kiritimatiellaeota bacterium B1221]